MSDMGRSQQDYAAERTRMVAQQLKGRGIRDAAVLAAMGIVPREAFIEEPCKSYAYDDTPLPIPAGQTISQPYVVARMISLLNLEPDERVLEIGTGSGYGAAVLSCIVREVYTVERHRKLVEYARRRLEEQGFINVRVHHGDGTLGWAEHAPYDAIIVAAGGPSVPSSLVRQLKIRGRLVMPVGRRKRKQRLVRVTREDENRFDKKELDPVAFVPLIGTEGWK